MCDDGRGVFYGYGMVICSVLMSGVGGEMIGVVLRVEVILYCVVNSVVLVCCCVCRNLVYVIDDVVVCGCKVILISMGWFWVGKYLCEVVV